MIHLKNKIKSNQDILDFLNKKSSLTFSLDSLGASNEEQYEISELMEELERFPKISSEQSRVHTNLFPYDSYTYSEAEDGDESEKKFADYMVKKGFFKTSTLNKYNSKLEIIESKTYPKIVFELDDYFNAFDCLSELPEYTEDKYVVYTLSQFVNEYGQAFRFLIYSIQSGDIQSYVDSLEADDIISQMISSSESNYTFDEFLPFGYQVTRTSTGSIYDSYSLIVASLDIENYEQFTIHIEDPSVSGVREVIGQMSGMTSFAKKLNL